MGDIEFGLRIDGWGRKRNSLARGSCQAPRASGVLVNHSWSAEKQRDEEGEEETRRKRRRRGRRRREDSKLSCHGLCILIIHTILLMECNILQDYTHVRMHLHRTDIQV